MGGFVPDPCNMSTISSSLFFLKTHRIEFEPKRNKSWISTDYKYSYLLTDQFLDGSFTE